MDYHSRILLPSTQQTVEILVLTIHGVLSRKGTEWDLMERRPRIGLQHPQMLKGLLPHLIQVIRGVLVLGRLHLEVQLAVRLVGLVKPITLRNVAIEFLPNSQSCLIGP